MNLKIEQALLNKSPARLSYVTRGLALSIAVLFLLWIFWNAFHAIPSADDFCYGFGARTRGIFQNVVTEYMTWGGRYTPAFLIGAFAASDKVLLHYYAVVPIFILIVNFLAVRHFLSTMNIKSGAFTLLFFVMLLATFRVRESLFWLAGGATYGIACALFLALIAEELRIFRGSFPLSDKRLAALSLGSLLLASFNETVMLAHIAMLLPLTLYCFAKKSNKAVAWMLAAAIIGALISGLAPGNFLRAATAPQHVNVLLAAANALLLIFSKYLAPLLVSVLLFFCLLALFKPRREDELPSRIIFGALIFLFFALWASIFARTFTLNDLGPERARTIDFMLVNVAAFLIALHLHARHHFTGTARRKSVIAVVLWLSMAAVALCLVFYPSRTWRPVIEGMQAAADLKALTAARFDVAKKAQGTALEVTGYTHEPRPITFFNDIKANPAEWENACFSQYFELKEVRLKPKS